jgi:hypothetical protein
LARLRNDLAGASAPLFYRLHRAGRFSNLGYSAALPLTVTFAMFCLGSERPAVDVCLMLIAVPVLFLALLRAKAVSGPAGSACGWLGRMSHPICVVLPVICLFSQVRCRFPHLTPLLLVLSLVATVWIEPGGRRPVGRSLAPPRSARA